MTPQALCFLLRIDYLLRAVRRDTPLFESVARRNWASPNDAQTGEGCVRRINQERIPRLRGTPIVAPASGYCATQEVGSKNRQAKGFGSQRAVRFRQADRSRTCSNSAL